MRTKICDLLGCEVPIFAFSHCRDVVVEVTKAGGFGVLGAISFSPEQLEKELRWIDAHVDGGNYGVDVLIPGKYALYRAQSDDAIRSRSSTGKWVRMLKSKWTEAWDQPGGEDPLDPPLQNFLYWEALTRIDRAERDDFFSFPMGQVAGTISEGNHRPRGHVQLHGRIRGYHGAHVSARRRRSVGRGRLGWRRRRA
jgi:NAD(P)H-dependent flavin oxidoreductase YrpB (nitropropane dioxygenase family)